MNDRKRAWGFLCVPVASVVALVLIANVRADEPKQNEKKPTETVKDGSATEKDPSGAEKPVPEKMTPRRGGPAAPVPTVKLKPGEVPAIQFESLVYDFGKARAGTEVIHEYKFKNTGTGPLEITKVKPGCGCTTAGEHTKIVQPGESGIIPIKLKPGHNAGPVNKRITVSTNVAGKDETIVLEIKGTVWAPVQVTPRSAAFGRLTPDTLKEGMTRTLTIVNNLDEPMKPGAIKSSNDAFGGVIKPVEEGKKYELTVSITDKIVGGSNSTQITIETGLEDPKTIDVPAYVFLSPPVDITPAKLQLPKPRSAELVRTFYIRSNTANTIQVSDEKATSNKLKLEIMDVRGDQRTYRLSVTIPADYEPPAQGDEITFKTSDPSMPIGRIPIMGTLVNDEKPEPVAN
jgi:Protein of unknown function (DUF1573)